MRILADFKVNTTFLIAWVILIFTYFYSLHNNLYLSHWDLTIYITQLVIDSTIGVTSYLLFKYRTRKIDQNFFLLLFISFVFGLITNEIYNLLINIVNIPKEVFNERYWSITYSVFLLLQLVAWGYLLKNSHQKAIDFTKKRLTLYPFLQTSFIISISIFAVFAIKMYLGENIKLNPVVNSLLEIINFTLISICLSRCKNVYAVWIATGLMLVMGFNLAHRFSDSFSIYYKTYNVAWLISLIIIIKGLLLANKNRNEPVKFFEDDSIHVIICGAFMIFTNVLLSIFLVVAFGLSALQIDKIPSFSKLALDIPGALIISYSLTILFAKYLAWQLSAPLEKIIKAENEQHTIAEKNSALLELAARVAHDIRSPIAAMEMSLHIVSEDVPAEKIEMMKMAVQSIRDIANNLLDKYRGEHNSKITNPEKATLPHDDQNIIRPILIQSLIEQAISQKRHEWQENQHELTLNISSTTKLAWIHVAPSEIKRMISNLLNNAAEACNEHAKITIDIDKKNDDLYLMITDNGVGMRSEEIDLFMSGLSSKHAGDGLGLSGAKKYMESIGGALRITSTHGEGTAVHLIFSCVCQPVWFPERVVISPSSIIVVLDDDEAMLSLWMHRLEKYQVKIYLFTSYLEASKFIKNNSEHLDKMIFLVDYELSDESINGLMLFDEFRITKNGYLVTSHAEESYIQQLVEQKNIWLIPKATSNTIVIALC